MSEGAPRPDYSEITDKVPAQEDAQATRFAEKAGSLPQTPEMNDSLSPKEKLKAAIVVEAGELTGPQEAAADLVRGAGLADTINFFT